jgi:hypothetical protein
MSICLYTTISFYENICIYIYLGGNMLNLNQTFQMNQFIYPYLYTYIYIQIYV